MKIYQVIVQDFNKGKIILKGSFIEHALTYLLFSRTPSEKGVTVSLHENEIYVDNLNEVKDEFLLTLP